MSGERRGNPQGTPQIGSLIPEVLKQVEHRHGALFLVQEGWGKLVGKRLAAHTKPVSLRRGTLIVHVDRPGDSYVLSYQRAHLLEQLRIRTNGKVEEIVVRAGEV